MTGTTQVSHAINNFYDRSMLERAQPLLVHDLFGQVKDIPKRMTETIKFRKYGALSVATTPLTEGVTPTGSDLSVTDITAVVSQYGDFVTLTDVVTLTSPDPVLTETAQLLGEQAGQTLDIITRDILNAGTNVRYADGVADRVSIAASTNVIDNDEIRYARKALANANARKITRMVNPDTGYNTTPVNQCYVAIIHPDITYVLDQLTQWMPVEKYARSAGNIFPGEIGKIGEVRFIETTHAKKFEGLGAAGIDVYSTLVMGMDAYGVTRLSGEALKNIIKPLGTAGSADPLNQRATSGWKAWKTAVILQQLYMIRLEHAAE